MSDAFYGLYSTSGFDLLAILTKVASRKKPTIDLGPIDLSCSFVVSDAQKEDYPIVYVSSTFENLTGYKSAEILGKNCRFLQAPGGMVAKGEKRKFADSQVVYEMKRHIEQAEECQFLNVNYKKCGEPFVNLITVIPVSLDDVTGIVTHFVGFQVDLLEQSHSILNRVSGNFNCLTAIDDRYVVNYNNQTLENLPDYIIETYGSKIESEPRQNIILEGSALTKKVSPISVGTVTDAVKADPIDDTFRFAEQDINESLDFVHILSSRALLLFVSDAFRDDVLQYDSKELVGKSLSEFCHPGDYGTLMKSLKSADLGGKITALYRFKSKYFGYIWLDIIGQKYELPNSKKVKCFLLCGRIRQLNALPHRVLVDNYIYLDHTPDLWLKISYYGLVLFVSAVCQWNPFGVVNSTLFGNSIYEYIVLKSSNDLKKELSTATVNHPIQLTITTKFGAQLFLCAYPCASFIFLRIKSVSGDINASTLTQEMIYPSTALYVDIFLPILENSSLGYQFEMNKLQVCNRKLKEEIQDVLNDRKRKF